ncbi:MAG: hypothetical protein Kow0031_05630 [Anaerolineae bacterium]
MIEQIRQVKARHQNHLLSLANVVGLGIGLKQTNGELTEQLALIVNVRQKLPLSALAPADVVPPEIDGVVTDVQDVGQLTPL